MKNENAWMKEGFSFLQWVVFLLANALSLPVVIGQLYHLSAAEVAGLMQRTFFVIGLTSFLQGWLGHRYPLADGPAGIWLGMFTVMGTMAGAGEAGLSDTLRVLEGAMIMAGVIIIVISAFRFLPKILFLFTPLVTGSFLMLLSLQLSGVFFQGMFGIGQDRDALEGKLLTVSVAVFVLVWVLSVWGKGWMKNYAVLIGIAAGWAGFAGLGYDAAAPVSFSSFVTLPSVFAWGTPVFDPNMILTVLVIVLLLLSNLIASVSAMEQVLSGKNRLESGLLSRSGTVNGVATLASSLFSTVGMVPLTVSAGFVSMTGEKRRRPYLAACLGVVAISCIPPVISFFAQLPGPVAYAVLLASFGQMFGIGLKGVLKEALDSRRFQILGITMSAGVGMMFLPSEVFQNFPPVIQSLMSNGLLVGMLICLVLEQCWRPRGEESFKKVSNHA
jgi:xanthine/uracil permease